MFPDVSRGTRRVLRCRWPTSGEGRCIKEKGGLLRWARVVLTARPAERFLLRLTQRWPESLGPSDLQAVESALVRGILEGTVRCEDPPWMCELECTAVEWIPPEA